MAEAVATGARPDPGVSHCGQRAVRSSRRKMSRNGPISGLFPASMTAAALHYRLGAASGPAPPEFRAGAPEFRTGAPGVQGRHPGVQDWQLKFRTGAPEFRTGSSWSSEPAPPEFRTGSRSSGPAPRSLGLAAGVQD